MQTYRGSKSRCPLFLNLCTTGKWLIVNAGRFTVRVRAPGTQKVGGWVDLRAGLDVLEAKVTSHLSGIELRIDQPVASSLRFQYRISMMQKKCINNNVKQTESGKCLLKSLRLQNVTTLTVTSLTVLGVLTINVYRRRLPDLNTLLLIYRTRIWPQRSGF
jgi:hypothetical protein